MQNYRQLMSMILTVGSLLVALSAQAQTLNALVTIRQEKPSSDNLMIQGTVIKDAALPNELLIITVAHGKKAFCNNESDRLLIEFREQAEGRLAQKIIVPCSNYEVSNEADTGFISLKNLSPEQTQKISAMAAQLAAYKTESKASAACSLVDSKGSLSKINTVFDGSYVQSVTKNIPGCSGSPLINSEGRVNAIFKGFALESNRSLYTPITLKSLQPFIDKVRKKQSFETKNLKEVLPSTLKGTRGDPLDGNPFGAMSQSKMAVPAELQRADDIPTYFIMKLPLAESVPNTQLIKEGSAYFSEENPLLSCTYSPAANDNSHEVQPGFYGLPEKVLNLRRFSEGFTNMSLHLQYDGMQSKTLIEDSHSTKMTFGSGRSDFLWHLTSADKFAVTLGAGRLQITDQDLLTPVSFKDPNICTRLLSVYSAKLQSYIHYNISMHLFAGKDQFCPYLDVIVKRAISKDLIPKNLDFQDFQYVEHMVSLPNSSGQKCLK